MKKTVRITVGYFIVLSGVSLWFATVQSLWAQANSTGPVKLSINRLSMTAIQGKTFEAECVLLS